MFFESKKCETKGCNEQWKWNIEMRSGPKHVEMKLCCRCATKIVKVVKGLAEVKENE